MSGFDLSGFNVFRGNAPADTVRLRDIKSVALSDTVRLATRKNSSACFYLLRRGVHAFEVCRCLALTHMSHTYHRSLWSLLTFAQAR